MEPLLNRINKRNFLVSNLESYIQESVYYRSYSFELNNKNNKTIIFNFVNNSGKGKIQ